MMNRENLGPCIVFPMGMEAHPFLNRVEVISRIKMGKAVYREVFFEGSYLHVVRCGVGPTRAAASMKNLAVRPSAIISAGTAGALVDDLRVGDLIISSVTVSGDDPEDKIISARSLIDAAVDSCRRECRSYRVTSIATMSKPVFSREERLALHSVTGAEAVDMESHVLGREAIKLGVPFLALRVISDGADSPPLPDFRSLKSLFYRPYELPRGLVALLRWRTFLKNLRRSVELLHPVLVDMIRSSGRGTVIDGSEFESNSCTAKESSVPTSKNWNQIDS